MYNKNKFYWLKLKEDFFDEDAIAWLEEQPNGKEYSLFYLKLCLKSLKTDGILIRQVGNIMIPYDHIKLAELTKTQVDTAAIALELLIKIGLIQRLEGGELYMTQLKDMVGSQTKGALAKQNQRLAIEGGQKVDKCPIEIEYRDRDRDKSESNTENELVTPTLKKHKYGQYGRVLLTEEQFKKLVTTYGLDFTNKAINELDEYVQSNNNKNKYKDYYLVIKKAIREEWFGLKAPRKVEYIEVRELTKEEREEAEKLSKELLGK